MVDKVGLRLVDIPPIACGVRSTSVAVPRGVRATSSVTAAIAADDIPPIAFGVRYSADPTATAVGFCVTS